MSLKDIASIPAVWGTAVLGVIGTIFGVVINKRENAAKAGKTEAEKNEIDFNLRIKMETYYGEQIKKLNDRCDQQDQTISQLNERIKLQDKKIEDQDEIIRGLKSEVSLYKTVNS